MNTKLKASAVLTGVFLLGGVAGVFGGRTLAFRHLHSVMEGPPAETRIHFRLESMRHELDLDDDQAKKVEAILRAADPEREQAMSACRPGLDELRSKTDAQIVEILRPEQRPRFDEYSKRRSSARKP